MIAPIVAHSSGLDFSTAGDVILAMSVGLFLWLFSGTPLLVSFVLAIKLKHKIPSVILLVSTIIYGVWFAFVHIQSIDQYMGALMFFFIGIVSLPVMIPAWITAMTLDAHYAKKFSPSGIAAVPSSLTLSGDENEPRQTAKSVMSIRNITIWTTALVLIGAISFSYLCYRNTTVVFLWLCFCSPLLVSLFLARMLKYKIPNVILLVSTIAFGIWYGRACYEVFTNTFTAPTIELNILVAGIQLLPVMIFSWVIALVLDAYYAKKQKPQAG